MNNTILAGVLGATRPGFFRNGVTYDTNFMGHSLGTDTGICQTATSGGILGIHEIAPGNGLHFVWYNLATDDFRDLGSFDGTIVDSDDAGFLLLSVIYFGSTFHTLIYNPNANTFADQGIPPGGQSEAVCMNASHVVGINGTVIINGMPNPHALRGFGGALTDIHPEVADIGGDVLGLSGCTAINASGHIVGTYSNLNGQGTGSFFNSGGASVQIAGPYGEFDVNNLNNSDVVCGTTRDGSGTFSAAIWTPNGGAIILPKLPETSGGDAQAINNLGWVVGAMSGVAFLHASGVTQSIVNIASAIDPLWTSIISADFVNDKRQIAGRGIYNGIEKIYLLTLA